MALHTLRAMAGGGMYDQIGGGFARYSVDARWVIPHFEKMLYDNALLARAYLHGFQVSGEELFPRVCTETLDWALRDLRQEEGGFASSLDADSEGEEGRFYVWTPDEMRAVAGDAAVAYFGLDGPPNFEGTWAPVRAGRDPEDLAAIKAALREARERRVWPGLDDKRLTAWNALMISALADAGGALERPDYIDAAVACAEFVWRDLRDAGAACCAPTTAAARSSAPTSRTTRSCSRRCSRSTRRRSTRAGSRPRASSPTRSSRASPTPSTAASSPPPTTTRRWSRAARSSRTRRSRPARRARPTACCGSPRSPASTATRRPRSACCGSCTASRRSTRAAFGHLLQALDFHLAPVKEVAIVGPDAAPLERVVRGAFRPHVVLAGRPGRRRPAARGPRARRRPRGGLRLRALRVPAPGHRTGRARRAALTARTEPESSLR